MSDGEVCLAEPLQSFQPRDALMCSLPAASTSEAAMLLEAVGSGGALGSGARATWLGRAIPNVRMEYEARVSRLILEVERRRSAGQASREIAQWVVEERARIANQMRWRTGAGTRVLFEVRDWTEYGPGGRTFSNVERRYSGRGLSGADLDHAMIRGATSPNTGISQTAITGARYLRNGGRVILVFSLATTAYVLLTASKDELERVMHQEVGSFIGGSIGTGAAVGACLVFGIATGGWGLLACGIVGGIGGGLAGAELGDRIYYSRNRVVEDQALRTGILNAIELSSQPPPAMCFAR
jgi:hypothetical protein